MTDRYALKNRKVLVFSGDGKTFLGEGIYLGETTVYAWKDGQGNLVSLNEAEKSLTEKQKIDIVTDGCKLLVIQDNPKIQLLNIGIVYGCQVWWTLKDDGDMKPCISAQEKKSTGLD